MRKRMANMLVALSVLLTLASTGLWITSYFITPCVTYRSRDASGGAYVGWDVRSLSGQLGATRTSARGTFPRDSVTWYRYTEPVATDLSLRLRLGLRFPTFDYRNGPTLDTPSQSYWSLFVPYWLIILITAPAPTVWWLRRVRARRRVSMHRCLQCGYDLRASVDRCPECGAMKEKRGK